MVLEPGKMYRPTDIAVDFANDAVYVVEQFNHRISKWDYTPGMFVFTLDTTWGDKTPTDGTAGTPGVAISDDDNNFYFPTSIALNSNDDLLVSDTLNHRIRVIDAATGTTFDSFGIPGTGSGGELYNPLGLDIDETQVKVMIADSFNHRIQTFDVLTPYNFVTFTAPASPIPLHTPNGVTSKFDDSEFYVSDTVNGIINIYDQAGQTFLTQKGTPGTETPDQLYHPGGGHVRSGSTKQYFADTFNHAIKQSAPGAIIDIINNPGTGDGQLYHPNSVILFTDTADYVLVANTLNNRIEVFDDNSGTPLFQNNFGSPLP